MSKKTALYDRHSALGAKLVEFAGWMMPLQYRGIIPEHQAVRQRAGIFDVSHMGRINVEGTDAEKALDFLSTNKIAGKQGNSATYTVWCHPEGGAVDDVIIYKKDATHFFLIVNASNRQKDLDHLLANTKKFNIAVQDRYATDGILAVQGPQAVALAAPILPQVQEVPSMHFVETVYEGDSIILSGTGYTGAGGFEIYGPNAAIVKLWDRLTNAGIPPVGLGARDTLRLEMGYALYGHELSDAIAPVESVSAWTVKLNKPEFLGRSALQSLNQSPLKRSQHALVMVDKGIPREGYEVFQNGQKIGAITSGTQSPTLNQGIGIVLSKKPLQPEDIVEVQIRDHAAKAKVTTLPFIGAKK